MNVKTLQDAKMVEHAKTAAQGTPVNVPMAGQDLTVGRERNVCACVYLYVFPKQAGKNPYHFPVVQKMYNSML